VIYLRKYGLFCAAFECGGLAYYIGADFVHPKDYKEQKALLVASPRADIFGLNASM
jgi:hypothetical protein